jgi:dTDP-6-deoxy-L-talose 4-dehydrogenase (NAD+)
LTLEFGKYPERPYDSPAAWGDSRKINAIMNARCR